MDADLCARPPKAVNKPGRHFGVWAADKLEDATLLLWSEASIDKVECLQQTFDCKSYIVIHVDQGMDVIKSMQRSRQASAGGWEASFLTRHEQKGNRYEARRGGKYCIDSGMIHPMIQVASLRLAIAGWCAVCGVPGPKCCGGRLG